MTRGKAQRRQVVLVGGASGLVMLWFGLAASYAIGTLWINRQGPFDPVSGERLDFWSGFREGASALVDFGRLWRLSSPVFWLVLVALVVLTVLRWEWLPGRGDAEGRWLTGRRWLLLFPFLAGLAWSPVDAYSAMAALYSMHFLNSETVGAALGEAVAAPWIGLWTAASLALASIFYRFVEPPRLKVWRRLTSSDPCRDRRCPVDRRGPAAGGGGRRENPEGDGRGAGRA